MKYRFFAWVSICGIAVISIFCSTCSRKVVTERIVAADQLAIVKNQKSTTNTCRDALAYTPYPENQALFPTQRLRLNFHFLNTEDKTNNFSVEESRNFVRQLVRNANLRLKTNHKMNLPVGNNTPVYLPSYEYVLHSQDGDDGIYFHYDDELCFFANKGKHRNNYNTDVIEKYAIGLDSIINVFLMPHIPESKRSKSYKVSRTGVALGNGLKIAGHFESKKKPWEIAPLLNHEVGHVLGLRHSWNTNDGCEDTPRNPNCWSSKETENCAVASNNVMDYNNSQMALTPCQLGLIHRQFNDQYASQRKLLVPQWCRYSSQALLINNDQVWKGARDLHSDVIVQKGTTLTIKCRVHLPEGAMIKVEPGARLVLDGCYIHNDCGMEWGGIEVMNRGRKKGVVISSGEVSLENVSKINS